MQAYLENLANGGGEPINVTVSEDDDGRMCIVMSSLRKQNRVSFALHVDREIIHGNKDRQDTMQSGTSEPGENDT